MGHWWDSEPAIREGRYFATAEAKRHTFGDLVDRCIREIIRTRSKNGSNSEQQLRWWKSELGACTPAESGPA